MNFKLNHFAKIINHCSKIYHHFGSRTNHCGKIMEKYAVILDTKRYSKITSMVGPIAASST